MSRRVAQKSPGSVARAALGALAALGACEGPPTGAPSGEADAARLVDATPPDAAGPDAAPPRYDCDALPPGPFELVRLGGSITASEDLAFDADGHLIGADDATIYRSTYAGERSVYARLSFRAGLRFSADGELLANDDANGRLVRFDGDGTRHTVLSGLAYPNGLAADPHGYVYVTEQGAGRVRRVHAVTGEQRVVAEGIAEPNGITFDERYGALYIGGFAGVGTIYRLPIDADGQPGPLEAWATEVGTGYLDGLAVDACGNVYVCDYGASIVYRISPDGAIKTPIIDASADGFTYLPNMQWGSGIGGWDAMKLYLPDGWTHDVFEVDVGVPGKPKVYP